MPVPNSPDLVPFIEDQLAGLDIRSARMFGESCLYCDGKVVGFVCDDILFIKPSPADDALFEETYPGKPYPGAKDYRAVPGDLLERGEWLREAIQATADALPAPKPKRN
jgi:TfoX/Sxy family transcriptional regulator of competence genes